MAVMMDINHVLVCCYLCYTMGTTKFHVNMAYGDGVGAF